MITLPTLVLEKIFRYAAGEPQKINVEEAPYCIFDETYFGQLKKFTKVCTAWRDFIFGSSYLIGDCKYFFLPVSDDNLEEAIDFIQSGFIYTVEDISFWESSKKRSKMDTMGFVRDHVKDKTTAVTTFQIDVNDFTNIEAWSEILASCPEASTFEITFKDSKLDVQTLAERFWKVLLAVFHCNEKDKTLIISGHYYCAGYVGITVSDSQKLMFSNEKLDCPGLLRESN